MPVVDTVVVWRLPITTMAWTWRAGGQTSTVMVDTREAAPAVVEVEPTQDTLAEVTGTGERPVPIRVDSMTAGRQSGILHIKITRLPTTHTLLHHT